MRANILIRNIASQSVMQVANLVLPFITIPYLTRIIGPDKFGVINYCTAIVTYFVLIVNFSFDMQASRAVAQNPEDTSFVNQLFSDILYTKVMLFLICSAGFWFLLYHLPPLEHEKQVAVYSYAILIGWVFTPNWLYQGKQELGKVALFNLAAKIIFTCTVFIFIHSKQQYIWQPLLLSIAQIVVGMLSFAYACRKFNIRLVASHRHNMVRVLKDGKDLFFSMVTINLYSNTTIIILGIFVTVAQVGYYSAAYRLIITAVSVLSIPLTQALYPFMAASFGVNKEKGISDLQSIIPLGLLVSFLYSVVFFVMGPFIIHQFYGPQFLPAVAIFRWLSAIPFLVSMNSFLGVQALLNLQRDKQFFRITLTSAVVGMVTALILGHFMGIRGGAISWLLAECCNFLLFYITLKRMSVHLFKAEYYRYSYFKVITIKALSHLTGNILFK